MPCQGPILCTLLNVAARSMGSSLVLTRRCTSTICCTALVPQHKTGISAQPQRYRQLSHVMGRGCSVSFIGAVGAGWYWLFPQWAIVMVRSLREQLLSLSS